jgi:hypothetical protein
MTINKRTETSISGTGKLTALEIGAWLSKIPADATIQLRESRTHPGEFGVEPWKLTASWEERDGMIHGDE